MQLPDSVPENASDSRPSAGAYSRASAGYSATWSDHNSEAGASTPRQSVHRASPVSIRPPRRGILKALGSSLAGGRAEGPLEDAAGDPDGDRGSSETGRGDIEKPSELLPAELTGAF